MKKIFLSFISILVVATVCLADESLAVQKLLYGRDSYTLEEKLTIEQYELQLIEEELSYLNNLLALKSAVNDLYKIGNIEKIQNGFNQRKQDLNKLLEQDKLRESETSINEMEIIYKDIPQLHDQMLYDQARLFFKKKDFIHARKLLEEIIQGDQLAPEWLSAYQLLAEIYFLTQADEELIRLFESHQIDKTQKNIFQFANALYNLEMYDQSAIEFSKLLNSSEYHFIAQSMIAVINYFQDDTITAIDQLQELSHQEKISANTLNFVLLNLGRIQILYKPDEAWQYFKRFHEVNETINDEILFEIANYYFEHKHYDESVIYLKDIINKIPKSPFYVSANFMLAAAQYSKQDRTPGTAIDSLIYTNEELLENIDSKLFFLEKYQQLQQQFSSIDSTDLIYQNLSYQLELVDIELTETNKQLEIFYRGSAKQRLNEIYILEEEYKNYSSILAEIKALILIARKMPRERFTDYINNQIDLADSSLVSLQVIRYLQAKPIITPADFKLARRIAVEKILQETDLHSWQEIVALASQKKNYKLLEKIDTYIDLLNSNILSYDLIADYIFNYSENNELDEYLNEEVAAIQKNKTEMYILQEEIANSFDNFISRQLQKQNDELEIAFNQLQDKYNDLLQTISSDINLENRKYEFELLDAMFKKSQEMDAGFLEMQKQMKHEN